MATMLENSRKTIWIIIIIAVIGFYFKKRFEIRKEQKEASSALMETVIQAQTPSLQFGRYMKNPDSNSEMEYLTVIYSSDSLVDTAEFKRLIAFHKNKILEKVSFGDSTIVGNKLYYVGAEGKDYMPLGTIQMVITSNGKIRF